MVITKITAKLIPTEVSILVETPKKEQRAMNLINRMLLIRKAAKNIPKSSILLHLILEFIQSRHQKSYGNKSSRRQDHDGRRQNGIK